MHDVRPYANKKINIRHIRIVLWQEWRMRIQEIWNMEIKKIK